MWNRGFLSLCIIVFVVGLITGPVHLFFPVYIKEVLGENPLYAALLRAIPIGLGGITALIGGKLCDRFGRKLTLLIGITGAIVIGSLFTTEIPLFIWGILCYEGVASGFKTAGGQTYLISSVSPERLGTATGLYFISSTVGSAIGNAFAGEIISGRHFSSTVESAMDDAIAGEIISRGNFSNFGIGAIILSGLVFICACIFLPRLNRPKDSPQNKEGSWKFTLNRGKYFDLLRRSDIWMLIGLRVFPTYYWGSVNLLMPILIHSIAGNRATGYYGTFSLLFAFTCQFAIGRICDAVGHRLPALLTNGIITILAFGLAVFHDSFIALEIFGILGAGAAWGLSTTIPRFINEFTDSEEKGHGVGLTHLAWSTGFLLGYVVSGILINISVHTPFIVAGLFLIGSTYIAYKLWHTHKKIRKELP